MARFVDAVSTPAASEEPAHRALVLGALGVVFGDIGTSPIYAFRESLKAAGSASDSASVLGVLSLIFWAVTIVVAVKYVVFVMRADEAVKGSPLKKVAWMSLGAISSAAKAALAVSRIHTTLNGSVSRRRSFDHLVNEGEERRWQGEAERVRGFEAPARKTPSGGGFSRNAVVGVLERVNQCSQRSDRRTPFCAPTPPLAELEVDRRAAGRVPLASAKKKPRPGMAGAQGGCTKTKPALAIRAPERGSPVLIRGTDGRLMLPMLLDLPVEWSRQPQMLGLIAQ